MWWIIGLALIFVAVTLAAVITERRRHALGNDAREDRFTNPNRDRYKTQADKEQQHGRLEDGGGF